MKHSIVFSFFILMTVGCFSQANNRWLIEKKDGRFGFIDSTGREVFTVKYFISDDFHDGLVRFSKRRKHGFLDTLGNVVFWVKYSPNNFSERLLAHYKDGWCYLNTRGEKAIDLTKLTMPSGKEISNIFDFRDGRAVVRIKDIGFDDSNIGSSCIDLGEGYNYFKGNWFYGFIDKTGNWVVEPVLESATTFQDGISVVQKDGQNFFMDINGNVVTRLSESVLNYAEGFAIGFNGLEFYHIARNGTTLSHGAYWTTKFSDGLAAVKVDGQWGFIDTTGTLVIKPQYYMESKFTEGLAPVHRDDKEGFIDKKGATVIPFKRNVDYGNFRQGLARGRKSIYSDDGRYSGYYELFYINRKGKKVWSEVVKQ